jgi:hypothetical protein
VYRKVSLACGGLALGFSVAIAPPVFSWIRGPLKWTDVDVHWTFAAAFASLGAILLVGGARSSGNPKADVRHLMTRAPRRLALAIGIVFSLMVLGGAEGVCYLLQLREHAPAEVLTDSESHYAGDDLLGYRLAPESRMQSKKEVDGKTIYDVVYTADSAGRRVTASSGPESSEEVVLFFGDSNTFGEGVNDDETMPYDVGLLVPGAAIYNYGFRGYGPQQMLAMLEDGRLDSLMKGRSVTAVYLFIDAHVQRAIGSMVVVTAWGADMPRYVLDSDDRPVLEGSFRSSRPITNWLYALASKSYLLSRFHIDLPPPAERHFHLTARIIEASAARIAAKAARTRFVVALHPTVKTGGNLKREFADPNVRVLDYAGLWASDDTHYLIEGDWHPTPLAHRTLAGKLVDDVFSRPW